MRGDKKIGCTGRAYTLSRLITLAAIAQEEIPIDELEKATLRPYTVQFRARKRCDHARDAHLLHVRSHSVQCAISRAIEKAEVEGEILDVRVWEGHVEKFPTDAAEVTP